MAAVEGTPTPRAPTRPWRVALMGLALVLAAGALSVLVARTRPPPRR